jgi:hypothetical protein
MSPLQFHSFNNEDTDIPPIGRLYQMIFNLFLFYPVFSFSSCETNVTTVNYALYLEPSWK